MKIKQIELTGFKSFSDKKVFRLHGGITCIVGPNGCGKSNIVDAFRWVLGEQSAKSLRGERMEEVIFQGSATVKQKGMAEVMLIISQDERSDSENGGGSPDDGSRQDNIIVSRRLFRSGESEYFLNKRQCRLKDIRDIFLDTGLDVKSYSILDQGKVSEIINTKPLERRYLIEETAGIMKYKVRKSEALSKLDSSKQNLQRINDIVYEVKRQINSLDRQVKKAERFKRLIDELKVLELRVAKREYIKLSNSLNSLHSDMDRLKEADSSKRSMLSTMETRMEKKRLELVDKEKLLAELENSLHSKEREVSESEKKIAILKNSMENRKADISRLANQQKEFDAKKELLLQRIEELKSETGALSSNMASLEDELREKKEHLSIMETAINEKDSEIETKRKELFRVSDALSHEKNELHKLHSALETLHYRESVSNKDMESVNMDIESLGKSIAGAEENMKAIAAEHSELLSRKDALTADVEGLKTSIEDKKTFLARAREDLASNTSRLNSLKELTADGTLMDFLSESQSGGGFSALILSDVITASKDHEKAIEAALSEKINSVILSNVEDILSLTNIVKDKHLGRTAILYTGFVAGGNDPGNAHLPDTAGNEAVIGRASDFLTFENPAAQEAAGRILQNIYIVKDLESAIELRKQEPFSKYSLATIDGEAIDPDGVILAGHGKDILKRKREIKELQKTIDEQQSVIETAEADLNAAAALLAEQKDSLKGIDNSIVDIEKEMSLLGHSISSQTEELEIKKRKLTFLNAEISTIAGEKESLRNLAGEKTEAINHIEKQRDDLNEKIISAQNSLVSVKAEYEEARSLLTDTRLAIASYKEKLEALQREASAITNTIGELEKNKEDAEKEIQDAEKRLEESLSELQDSEENIKAMVVEADALRQERASRKEAIDSENQALVEESNALKKIRSEIDVLSQELSGLNSKAVESRLRIENIESSIMQKYGLEISKEDMESSEPASPEGIREPSENAAEIVGAETSDETKNGDMEDAEKINRLNDKIRELGPVNLGTIEEYEELKNRYDFLTKQQNDLTMSIAELEEAISRINASTKRKLREAYEALRAKFSEVFTVLFGGGKADIILTDEENILDSGIDIIAQPPGKKLQNINLLSGGEKALTSLAILFAGFLIKPSPLCVLDEVDAPLDESNTVRFAQMIKELSKETQFIVITHNKTTMEISDFIYGITMEEPGVSKAISLQFADMESMN